MNDLVHPRPPHPRRPPRPARAHPAARRRLPAGRHRRRPDRRAVAGRRLAGRPPTAAARPTPDDAVGSALIGQASLDEPAVPCRARPRPARATTRWPPPAPTSAPRTPSWSRRSRSGSAAVAAREGVDPADVPADALTASASGLDPHISPAYAALQVPRVARENGLSEAQVAGARRGAHRRPDARLPRRAPGRRAGAQLGRRRPGETESMTGPERRAAARRSSLGLPRCRARRRQDLRDARRGAPAPGAGHRRGRRRGRDPRAPEHRRPSSRGSRSCRDATVAYRGVDVHRDGHRRDHRPGARGGAGRRARPHQRAGQPARQAAARTSRRSARAGIDVITTVNIQHLASLNDEVERITGVRQRETVPDDVVRAADQIQLVDMSPQALRRRMAHGNVYQAEQIDASLTSYFRVGNLTALRELALLWVADRVDDALDDYRREHRIDQPWPARERVVVAITGGSESEAVHPARGPHRLPLGGQRARRGPRGALRRPDRRRREPAARLARAGRGADGVPSTPWWATTCPRRSSSSPAASTRRWSSSGSPATPACRQLFTGSTATEIARLSGPIDVHLVTHDSAGAPRRWRRSVSPLSRGRQLAGWGAALVLPALLTLVLQATHTEQSLSMEVMFYLATTVLVAMIGGLLPALVTALAGFLLLNWFFTPPVGRWTDRGAAERRHPRRLRRHRGRGGVGGGPGLAPRRGRRAGPRRGDRHVRAVAVGAHRRRHRAGGGVPAACHLRVGVGVAAGPARRRRRLGPGGQRRPRRPREPRVRGHPGPGRRPRASSPCAGGSCGPPRSASSTASPCRPGWSWSTAGCASATPAPPRSSTPRRPAPPCCARSRTTCVRRSRRSAPPSTAWSATPASGRPTVPSCWPASTAPPTSSSG